MKQTNYFLAALFMLMTCAGFIFYSCGNDEEENTGNGSSKDPSGREAYITLTEDSTVLTFYFDNQRESRRGSILEQVGYNVPWSSKRTKITTVVFDPSFANYTELTTTYAWFANAVQLREIIGIEYLKTSKVTTMEGMFSKSPIKSIDLSTFETSSLKSMSTMFMDCELLETIVLGNFNTANVTNMYEVFRGCNSLTTIDISSFDTRKVTNMEKMFKRCKKLKTIYVKDLWSTESVTSGTDMFSSCYELKGGMGTSYSYDHEDHSYARVDQGPEAPGYFTYKE